MFDCYTQKSYVLETEVWRLFREYTLESLSLIIRVFYCLRSIPTTYLKRNPTLFRLSLQLMLNNKKKSTLRQTTDTIDERCINKI